MPLGTTQPVFQDALGLLEALAVEGAQYVVVDAHALVAHGIPRATADFDVLVGTGPQQFLGSCPLLPFRFRRKTIP